MMKYLMPVISEEDKAMIETSDFVRKELEKACTAACGVPAELLTGDMPDSNCKTAHA